MTMFSAFILLGGLLVPLFLLAAIMRGGWRARRERAARRAQIKNFE